MSLQEIKPVYAVSGITLQQVETFKYPGVVFMSDGRRNRESDTRIGNGTAVELNWIYWQTANEGRPRPEEIIGNAKINTKEKW